VIPIEGNEHDLWREAYALQAWMQQKPDARVVLLSNRFDGRRWLHVLDTVLGAERRQRVSICALSDPRCNETNWWRTRSGFKNVFRACVELAYAWRQEKHASRCVWRSADEYERMFLETVERAE
jgi:hypothetical protein